MTHKPWICSKCGFDMDRAPYHECIEEKAMKQRPIVFQPMPVANTCMSACIAMLTGLPVNEVIEEFHDGYYHKKAITPELFLHHKGISFEYEERAPYVREGTLHNNKVYLLCVPSVNAVNQTHAVILDTRFGATKVYDPSNGFAEHSLTEMGNNMYDLRCWSISLIINM